ncbi:MAG TPA: bifunctional 2-polyprenyl-6-hydroxyphenol methylase/3-demethylubiquinol 3-O-methyltransferase UbiG [Polyangiaceae bacterium]|nr:bifunctional 2-polyprenyl-6-hydroxyphenol methylase/3-demethylubiquinol 3-O-methyltransferase UbiG [Polyangiaceae bacterium]
MEANARPVNNAIYSELGDRWYDAHDDPVALLRAESRHRNPWVARRVERAFGGRPVDALDVGCGAGFLSNYLAARGHRVSGLDASAESLEVARRHDPSRSVDYRLGDALALPYPDASFDVACAMDFLEHVEHPARAVAEIARVLRPSGLFFFHTFNRNALAYLVIIKAVEWFVKNTPRDMHVLRLFLRPDELAAMCRASGLEPLEVLGSRPRLGPALLKLAATGVVPDDFAFTFSRSTLLAYTGVARREAARP